MLCAISGEPPQEPVFSPKSGHVFERRLIEKYLDDHRKCPITDEPLSFDELIPVKNSQVVKPRPPSATSLPSLLSLFQSEWDALILESFQLKQQYQQARQELSNALYQNDAACRVIARLLKERDEAREALVNIKSQLSVAVPPETRATEAAGMEVEQAPESAALPAEVMTVVDETAAQLSSTRRKRKAPEGHTTREQLAEFQELTSVTLHSASTPGIVSVDVNPQNASLLCTAGQDKNVLIYDKDEDKTIATLKGHTKAVHKVLWHPSDECILSASADKTVKAWKNNGKKWAVEYTLKTHERDVTSLSIHPSGNYFLSASMDGTWALNDFNRGETVLHYDQQKEESGYAGISFHPDGVLFASGSASESGIVKLWDVKSQQVPFQCPDAHAGSANSLVFSENGYYFATAGSEGSVVKIWDLRKMQKIQEIDVEAPVQAVRFDYSGQYLAVGSADVRIFLAKQWTQLAQFGSAVSDLVFTDKLASSIVTVSADRHLKCFGVSS